MSEKYAVTWEPFEDYGGWRYLIKVNGREVFRCFNFFYDAIEARENGEEMAMALHDNFVNFYKKITDCEKMKQVDKNV